MSEPPRKFQKLTFKSSRTATAAAAAAAAAEAAAAAAAAEAEAAAAAAATSLLIHDVLEGCPGVAIAFRSAILRERTRGLGMKNLCLVSKGMMGAVLDSYHLVIDVEHGADKPLPSALFWGNNKLIDFRVTVIGDPEEDSLSIEYMSKLLNFFIAARLALRTVTTIHLVQQEGEADEEHTGLSGGGLGKELTYLFILLAGSCPLVQRLRVEGDVGEASLAAFRNAGSSLTSLETNSLPAATLGKLDVLLPRVTTTVVNIGFEEYDNWAQDYPGDPWFREMLCSGIRLTQLDVSETQLDDQAWRALQAADCLESIIFRAEDTEIWQSGPPAGTTLPGLRRFETNEPRRAYLTLVGNLLRAAPKLARFSPMTLTTFCESGSISDLVLVDQRVAAGLTFYYDLFSPLERQEGSPNISLENPHSSHLPVSEFASLLPVLTHISSLELVYLDTMIDRSTLKVLAKAFPSLQIFGSSHQMDSSSLPALAAFPALSKLYLSDANGYDPGFTVLELGGVCLGIPLLKELRCALSDEDVEELRALLCEWDRAVIVSSSGEYFNP